MDTDNIPSLSDPHACSVSGVWRLDDNALLALDIIIQEECTRIREDAKKRLNNAVRKAREQHKKDFENLPKELADKLKEQIKDDVAKDFDTETETAVKITFQDAIHRVAPTCKQLLNDGTIDNERAVKIQVFMKRCAVKGAIEFPETGDLTAGFTKEMKITASARDSNDANAVRARLLKWANDTKSPPLHFYWVKFSFIPWMVALFALVFLSLLMDITAPSSRALIKQDAEALLAEGINDGNRDKAIALILARIAEVPRPDVAPFSIPMWYWLSIATCLMLVISFSFAPYDTIGIGKGKRSIQNRRWFYQKAVWVFVTIILAPVLGTLIADLIKSIAK